MRWLPCERIRAPGQRAPTTASMRDT
jgi:hypothetical protein